MPLKIEDHFLNMYTYLFGYPVLEKVNKFVLQCGLRGLGCMNWTSTYFSGEQPFAATAPKTLGFSWFSINRCRIKRRRFHPVGY